MPETLRDIAIYHSESLIEKSRNGDHQAFGKLVGLWFKRIYNFSMKYFSDHDLAMEVTQRTFIVVHQKINGLRDIKSFKYWLYKVAMNQCHEEERSRKRRSWFSIFQPDIAKEIEDPVLNPQIEFQHRELEEFLQHMLKILPEDQKTVVIMKEYEGMKFREIAETLGISENTAKSRLYYGLKNLKKTMDEKGLNIDKF